MKQFIRRSLLYLIPLMLVFTLSELLLRNIPNDYKLKATYYRRHSDETETLILGNSYGFYDLDPRRFSSKTFNGAHIAQTLDLDAALFEKYAANGKRLRNVIIPVCDESLYFRLYTSSENWRIKNYTIYYNIYSPFRPTDYSENLGLPFSINRNRLMSYYLRGESAVTSSAAGFGLNFSTAYQHNLDSAAVAAVAQHQANDTAEMPIELSSLRRIIALCSARNIRVWLVMPPASREYYSTMPPAQIEKTEQVCAHLQQQNSGVRFFNFRKDSRFTPAEFFDADHLNGKGAAHFSALVDSILERH